MREQRIGDGAGDRTQRRLVQHDGNAGARLPAKRHVGDVAFQEAVPIPCIFADRGTNFVQIAPISGRKVVEADYMLAEAQQRFDKMGTNESGAAGYQPTAGRFAQFPVHCFAREHQSLHT